MTPTPDHRSRLDHGSIHVRVLGELNLFSWRAQGLGSLGGRYHVRAALALLAAAPDGLEKEALMDALWPESGARSAANRLHHTTHLLRRRLSQLAWPADWIHIGGDAISLDSSVSSDARSLHLAARNPHELDLNQLASLILGIGSSAGWVPGLDAGELGTRVRERCAQDFQTVLYEACERAVAYGDTPIRRSLLAVLLQSDPANEWAWRETMILDMQASRRFHVQRSFAAVSRELTLRLGLRPSLKTLKIARTVLDTEQTDAIAPALPSGVTKPVDAKIMTDAVLAGGVYNVFGLDGVGKTTLMRAVEAQLAELGAPAVSYWDAAIVNPLPGWPDLFANDEIVVVDHLRPSSSVWFEQLIQAAARPQRARTFILLSGTPVLSAELIERLPPDIHSGLLSVLPAGVFDPVQCQVVLSRLLDPNLPLSEAQLSRLALLTGGIALAGQKLAVCLQTMSADEVLDRPDALFDSAFRPGLLDGAGHQCLQASFDEVCTELSSAARQIYPALSLVAGVWPSGLLFEWLSGRPGCESPGAFARLMAELGAVGLISRDDTGAVAVLPLARIHARRRAVTEGLFESLLDELLDFLQVDDRVLPVSEGAERTIASIESLMSLEPLLRPLLEDSRRYALPGYLRFVGVIAELALAKGELSFGIRLCSQALDRLNDDSERRLSILKTLVGLLGFARPGAGAAQLCAEVAAVPRSALDSEAQVELEARLLRAYKASGLPPPPDLSPATEHRSVQAIPDGLPIFLAAGLSLRRAKILFAQEEAGDSIRRLVGFYGRLVQLEPSQLHPRICRLIADHSFFLADFEGARLWLTLAREHRQALLGAQAGADPDDLLRDWLLQTFVKSENSDPAQETFALPRVSEAVDSKESLRLRVLCGARSLVVQGDPERAAQVLGVFEHLDPAFIGAFGVSQFLSSHLVAPQCVLTGGESRTELVERLDKLLNAVDEPVMH